MKTLLKQLASESAIYGISSMLTKVIGIFLVPLYTRLLTPADYGSLNLVNSTFYFIIVLAVFALDSASARWFYDTHDIEDRKKTISSWFWFQMIASVVFAFIIILGSSFFSRIILNETKPLLFIIPALGLLANVLPGMVTNWLRFQRKAIHTVIFTVSNVLLNIGLNILFVLYLKWGVMGVLAAL
ncbi:MAG TPA: oligosaccharide flippase family protein, partial [Chitinophagaceae bacterium]|nr:oligosaccharide flippase family protein [Chitinophagaceae bacterium]